MCKRGTEETVMQELYRGVVSIKNEQRVGRPPVDQQHQCEAPGGGERRRRGHWCQTSSRRERGAV